MSPDPDADPPPAAPGHPPLLLSRFIAAAAAALAIAAAAELARCWPRGAPVALAALLTLQLITLTAVWAVPLALVELAAAAAIARWRRGGRRLPASALVLVPPALYLYVTAGQPIYLWATRSFVRQDLAGAVVPALLLGLLAGCAALAGALHALIGARLARLPRAALLGAAGAGAALVAGAHLARSGAIARDAAFPVAIQVLASAGAGAAAFAAPARWLRWRPRWITLGVAGALVAAGAGFMLFGARLAPLVHPVATAAIDGRGLAAARLARVTARVGDGDGDGFARFFAGADCDDGDPAVHPLAKELPGNGVDDDCFEGDLDPAVVAADRAARAARRPPRARARNLVLITMDALRADGVGFGGAEVASSPRLDALAARATVFTHAYTAAPMTRRAFPALLSGRYPANLTFRSDAGVMSPVVTEQDLYLAEVVVAAGIETGSVLAFAYAHDGKFDQGFRKNVVHRASQFKREANADVLVRDAVAMVRAWQAAHRRFFLWIHFYEPHFPYSKHPGIDFGGSPRERYLAEVRWVDDNLAPLLAALEPGLAADTAIILTGDHGEELGEHGGEAHGDLHIEDLNVPLLIYVPGGPARRIDTPVSLVDVTPSALELLGLEIPAAIDGDSLVPWLEGAPPPADRFVYAELLPDRKVPARQMTTIDARWQLVIDLQSGARQLYDIAADHWGTRNLVLDAPDTAIRLEERLRRHLALRIGPVRLGPPLDPK